MEVRFRDSRIDRTKADLLLLPVRAKRVDTPEVDALNRRLKGHLRAQIQRSKFTGAEGSALLYPSAGMLPANQILLIGIGSASESVLDSWRTAGARGAVRGGARRVPVRGRTRPRRGRKKLQFLFRLRATRPGPRPPWSKARCLPVI